MARHSRELGIDTSTPFAEENLEIWHPSSCLGPFGNPTPVPQTADRQCLHDPLLGGLSTMVSSGCVAAPTFGDNPFFIDHDATEPWPRMPIGAFHDVPGAKPRHGDSTEPKEPTRPAKRTPRSSGSNERRLKKKAYHSHQRPSRPDEIHRDLRCTYSGCEYNRPFSTKGSLMRHIDTQHENPWAFKCLEPTCGRYFRRRDNRDDHMRRLHWKKRLHLQSHDS